MKFEMFFSYFVPVMLIFGCFSPVFGSNFISFGFTLFIPVLFVINFLFLIYWVISRKRKLMVASAIAFLLYFVFFDLFYQINLTDNKTASETLSILTFNVKGFEADKDGLNEPIVDFITEQNADVLCLQEFSAIKYKKFKMYPYWIKTNIMAPNQSVMAVFSKFPIVKNDYIDFPNSTNGALFIDIQYKNDTIRIYNIHLESYKTDARYQLNNSENYLPLFKRISKAEKVRKAQAFQVKEHIDISEHKTIVCGDFNSTQFSLSYSILRKGLQDSFVEKGNGFGATYRLFNYPFRLDYILPDDDFKILSHQNFDLKLSDHEPVFAELRIKTY